MLAEVPASEQVQADLRAWGTDRLMAHYRSAKPWCELILNRWMPLAVLGEQHGLSLLFPMEKLFEKYVAAWLRVRVKAGTQIRTPAASESLCSHADNDMFPSVYGGRGAGHRATATVLDGARVPRSSYPPLQTLREWLHPEVLGRPGTRWRHVSAAWLRCV